MSQKALAPVGRIIAAARTISSGNLSRRLEPLDTNDELEQLSDTLNEMLSRLEVSFSRITQFTADASHELRTPLALIQTEAELTLRKTRTEAEYQGALQHILSEVERTSVLVADLLRVARTDSGVETFALRLLNLGEIVQIVGERWAPVADARGLKFSVEIAGSDFAVLGDRDAVRRLLDSLLENAMKYTPSPGAVTLSLSNQDNNVLVRVADTGIGISEGDVPKVFERFYRSDPARNRESGGAGLGLSIAKWIVGRHSGKIEVCSSLGQGSIFMVTLPTVTQNARQNNTLQAATGAWLS